MKIYKMRFILNRYYYKNYCCFLYDDFFELRSTKDSSVISNSSVKHGFQTFRNGILNVHNFSEKKVTLINLKDQNFYTIDFSGRISDSLDSRYYIGVDYEKRVNFLFDSFEGFSDYKLLQDRVCPIISSYTNSILVYNMGKNLLESICLKTRQINWKVSLGYELNGLEISSNSNVLIAKCSSDSGEKGYLGFDVANGDQLWQYGFTNERMLFSEDEEYLLLTGYNYYRLIQVQTGEITTVNLPESMHIGILFIRKDGLYYKSRIGNPLRDWRFGRIALKSDFIEWEYVLKTPENKIIEFRELSPMDNGEMFVSSTDPIKQTILFDPYDPENIPYRTIDNGVINDKNNPYPL